MCFEILYESDIWIGNSGNSSHSTNNKTGTVSESLFGSASLGHTGEAVKATGTIDVSGQFVTHDGTLSLEATLNDVNYNGMLNFI